ncbi:MAG: PDZ domain-containing protein [Verrucomicrobiota bacterium]
MKRGLLIALMLAPAGLQAAEPAEKQASAPQCHEAPRAWLGLRLSKPDEAIRAHLPALPSGVGFVVDAVDASGPAETAGLRALDLLWKFGDQMLINEAQLATLLRLASPGEEVAISGFRAGQPLEVKLRLGVAPPSRHSLKGELTEAAILPDACAGPMRVVNVSEKVASFTADEGSASVQWDGRVYQVRIDGPDAKPVFTGELVRDGRLDAVPESWRRKIQVLCRTLDQAITGSESSTRQPRPRVVPPPAASR